VFGSLYGSGEGFVAALVIGLAKATFRMFADFVRPFAAAVAAGTAAANCLSQVFNGSEHQAIIDEAWSTVQAVIDTHFASVPILTQLSDGTHPWPQIVADAIMQDREGDGSEAGVWWLFPWQ
jgi:hypothetical protein